MSAHDFGAGGEENAAPAVFITPRAQVVRASHLGETVFFTVSEPNDYIQAHHLRGEFYELEELEIIKRYFPLGGVFADIGANVGNHTLFALMFLRAALAIQFEPNPAVAELLVSNVRLNRLDEKCDLRHLGVGLAAAGGEGFSVRARRRNLGGGRLVEDGGGLKVIAGDEALAEVDGDFIKIDVEGKELEVLGGLGETLARSRPLLFVEVDNENRKAFVRWTRSARYEIVERFKRYPGNVNFLCRPMPSGAE